MLRATSIVFLSILAFGAAACGNARVVKRTQTGGVLALEGSHDKAMERAHQIMGSHCGGPYTVVEEGEHVVGVDTVHDEETYVDEYGNVVTEGGQSSREAKEWRIRYVCGQGQPAPGPQPAPQDDYGQPAPPPYDDQGDYDDGYDDGYDDQGGYDDEGGY